VRVLDNLATGKRENLAHCLDRIELIEGDIRDAPTCDRACEGVRVIFHQAALGSVPRSMKDPATTIAVNVGGTANVFAAARDAKVQRVVYASSSSVYGDSEKLPKREGEEGKPLSPYALSKVMNEQLAGIFGRCFGMEFVGLRYFNVYGPRQDPDGPYAAVIPRFFRALAAGEPPIIYGDGEQSRDFTFVADAVVANLLAAQAPAAACAKAYNVAPGTRTTIRDLARLGREIVGAGRDPVHEAPRRGDVRDSKADPTTAREVLGFVAATTLTQGLRQARAFYLSAAPGAISERK
jgi:nucleoside-diphosphate-sugar epimerase